MDVQAIPIKRLSDVGGYTAGPPPKATPGANTAFFPAVTIRADVARATVTIACQNASILSYKKNAGNAIKLNGGTAIAAGTAAAFELPVVAGDTLSFQIDNAGDVWDFLLDGQPWGA